MILRLGVDVGVDAHNEVESEIRPRCVDDVGVSIRGGLFGLPWANEFGLGPLNGLGRCPHNQAAWQTDDA